MSENTTPAKVAAKATERKQAEIRRSGPTPIRKDFDRVAREVRGESKAFGFRPAPLTGKTSVITTVAVR